ncbi:MAG TPA: HDOD domain-containing protein [Desulfobacteraceae bacterium]|nr:HDOD domain-containing protein [Desulfobacteraceae bacterium]
MTSKNKIFETLGSSDNLPKLPQVMLEIVRACSCDTTDTRELTRIISADPALTSKLLTIIGSGYVYLPKEISSIETAVVYLGMDTIKNIALTSAAMRVFQSPAPPAGFDLHGFWFDSYKCAVIFRKLAQATGQADPEESFLTGLLHGTGRLVLMHHFPDDYPSFVDHPGGLSDEELLAVEKEQFGADAFDVSSWLFQRWNLNPLMADALLYINTSGEEIKEALPPVNLLYLAKRLTNGNGGQNSHDLLPMPETHFPAGLSPGQVETMAKEAEDQTRAMAESLGIDANVALPPALDSPLGSKIKEISLFHGTMQSLLLAKDLDTILHTVEQGLKIVFNVPRVFFFLFDRKKKVFAGRCSKNDIHHRIVGSLAIPQGNTSSIITRSLAENGILTSLTDSQKGASAVSDVQMARLMGTDGIAALPMDAGSREPVGVILLGINAGERKTVEANKNLAALFSKQCALCIQNLEYEKEQAERVHNEKMEALTTVTRKIVHEINNPLGVVSNYIKMLSMKLPDKHPAQGEIQVVSEEIQRIAALTERLSTFSEPEINAFESVDLNQELISMLTIMKKSLLQPRGIEAAISPDTSLPRVKTDRNSIKQVFINLLKNAAEALDKGGKIDISTRFLNKSEKLLIDEKKKLPGSVEIVIQDNGPGMDPAIGERLFDPYVSSKGSGNSGLGLSIVQQIIRKLNGTITCTSKEPRGTCFTIILPVASARKR